MAAISLAHVSHRYRGAPADTFTDLSLDVADGEAHALLGGSGAGKSTLLNLLSGLDTPTAGRLLFGGQDVTRIAPADRGVAQVFQFPVLFESMTVADNLAFGLLNRGVSRRCARRRVEAISEQFDLADIVGCRPKDLSLFEKQIVAIARAFVREDLKLILLDEPLTAIEPATKWRLRRLLTDLQSSTAVTMIYVTHDQTEALTFASRISVMAHGELLQTAAPETLYSEPSHEYVAHFIGAPGMSLLIGEIRDGGFTIQGSQDQVSAEPLARFDRVDPGIATLGARPEWVSVTASPSGSAHLDTFRVEGTRDSEPHGLAQYSIGEQQVWVRGAQTLIPERGELSFASALLFRDGVRLDARFRGQA